MIKYFNFSLKEYNSFGIDVSCDSMVFLESEEDIINYLPQTETALILGGGSNILCIGDIHAPCVKLNLFEITLIKENTNHVIVRVGAGVNWHSFVEWAIEHNYGGIENLSLIPGTVGASPIQNIGAYGVELDSCIHQVFTYHLETGEKHIFSKSECEFTYRDSLFKSSRKGEFLVYQVEFKLSKAEHQIEISYAPLKKHLHNLGIERPTIKDVSQAVISIRQSKLPDPAKIGNAGSFFKNPIIDIDQFHKLKEHYPEIPSYPIDEEYMKIPAAWLIDQCGWKGRRFDDVGVHKKHALVLVNYGKGSGTEIFDLSEKIMNNVNETFSVQLEREVNIINLS